MKILHHPSKLSKTQSSKIQLSKIQLPKICFAKLMLALAIGLAMPSAFANNTTITVQDSDDGIIAKVNDEIILKSEFVHAIEAIKADYQKRGINILDEQIHLEAMDMLIMQKLQLGLVRRVDMKSNEALLNQELLKIAQAQGFHNLTDFKKSLDAQKMGAYEAVRKEVFEQAVLQSLWQQQIASRVRISKQDIDDFLASNEGKALHQDEYQTTHIRVPFTGNTDVLSDGQRQGAYAVALRIKQALEVGHSLESAMQHARGDYPESLQGTNTDYFRANNLPIELAGVITKLQVGQVSAPIATSSGYDVIMLRDKRVGGRVMLPEWQTAHILIKVDDKQSQASAEKKITELYHALQQGANFEELALNYSQDGSAMQQGQLGWVSEGQMVPEFEAMMKNTQVGDYSTPFSTQFGYHILKVNDLRQRDVTELALRRQAEAILFERQAPKAQEDWLQQLRASAYIEFVE